MANKKKKKSQKNIKDTNKTTVILVVIFLILGLSCGAITMFFLTKNDTFELIGESEIELNVGDTYLEQSAKAIAFGKDISKDVKVIGEVDTSKEGEYVVKYTVDYFRFKGYTLYRKVVIKEAENG